MTSTRFCLVILGFVVTCAGNLTSGGEQDVTGSDDVSLSPVSSDEALTSPVSSDNVSLSPVSSDEALTSPVSGDDILSRDDTDVANSTIADTPVNTTSIPSTNSTTNQTSSTSKPSTTLETDNKKLTTPRPTGTTEAKPSTTKSKDTSVKPKVAEASSNSTGLIILIVILVLAVVFVAACCWTRRRGRRYSVDPTSRADDVNIPLSAVEPTDPPADAVPHNGLQTFESAEATSKEPEVKPDAQEEQKAEADGAAVEPSAESASPAPDGSEDKPEEPAPVEPSTGEKADGEGLAPNHTPEEPLNENNSNNAATARDLKVDSMFWDVPLHGPV